MGAYPLEQLVIGGYVAPGFEDVREVFLRNFIDGIEVGASFAVMRDGEMLVDLWGGFRERACTSRWHADTLVNLYSTTKGIASIAVAVAVDRGKLDYDVPIAEYWPEFAAHGKGALTVGEVLAHKAGVCGPRARMQATELYDFERVAAMLAAMEPWWAPGTAGGYHAITWGFLPGELVRRTCGTTLGQLFNEAVAAKAGAGDDIYIGMPAAQTHRVAEMIGPNHARIQPPPGPPPVMPALFPVALQNPVVRPYQDVSTDAWRTAEIAAANGQGNARGLARVYGALAQDGGGIVSPATLARATRLEIDGEADLVLGYRVQRSRGFMHNFAEPGMPRGWGPNPAAFGHNGAGGSIGFCDPAARVGCGYAMNQMQPGVESLTRGGQLVNAFYDCLARA